MQILPTRVTLGFIVAGVLSALHAPSALGQMSQEVLGAPPIVGGTGGLAFPNSDDKRRFGLLPNQHKTVTGKPCVEINGMVRAQIVNPNTNEHVLIIANGCSYPIDLKVCYYQSTTCIKTTVARYSRRQQTLGFASDKDFRFSYTEDFNWTN